MFIIIDSKDIPYLNHYAKNISNRVNNNYEYAVGREQEIQTTMQVLLHARKSNPILIGEAGVGKTSLVEGLAQLINVGAVPSNLSNFQIYELNLGLMDTNFDNELGYFNDNLSHIIQEATLHNDEIILFIDEIHTIMGASKNNEAQGMDASQILKPPLARGSIHLIGATTFDEYHEYIEPDRAFQRRLMPITLEEPDIDTSVKILKKSLSSFESHYGYQINIEDNVFKTMVELSIRYLTDQFLPDKAFDLLDSSISEALLAKSDDFDDSLNIDINDIAKAIYRRTGVLTSTISASLTPNIKDLENRLKADIKGQDEAIQQIVHSLDIAYAGMNDPTKPLSSFIFLGTPGVGKTETVKSLAKNIFHDEKNMIRLDMGSYTTKDSIERLIGSRTKPGDLTGAVSRKPYSIVLLDEIEKSTPAVRDLLLSILDEGQVQDGRGRTVNFRNEIIILTSNLGSDLIKERAEWLSANLEPGELVFKNNFFYSQMTKYLKYKFRPEFVDRFDNKVVFNVLDKYHMIKITQKYLSKLEKRLLKRKEPLHLNYNSDVVDYLVSLTILGNDRASGARPLMRVLQQNVGGKIAHTIIQNADNEDFANINTISVTAPGKKPGKQDMWGNRSFKFKATTMIPNEIDEQKKKDIFSNENIKKMIQETAVSDERINQRLKSDGKKLSNN
ncbi:AAA family ATPase [Apilactobacillus timberlakei]|uniref:AAA family ATPase n=1 Tax=Apilactobacillus timberlakei TaxID=2008380 RepID=UPI001127B155|nr:ATP-dependent Clp protease ATP-binding subunit [Apilactobacillus timberlakei]TPR16722.1 ATP-dependent Clp protease ATP-binding subunit [Apilactobacillus timberlakei]TPR21584.1 ATP-dependent Clp protease ATP-binding subunit [Apilactobacillus timberlakei]